jgi:hypothetical protein
VRSIDDLFRTYLRRRFVYALAARFGRFGFTQKRTLNRPFVLDVPKKTAIIYLFEDLFEREDYDIKKVLDFGGGSGDLRCRDFGSQDST